MSRGRAHASAASLGLLAAVTWAGCAAQGPEETGTPLGVTGPALAVLAADQVALPLDSVAAPRVPGERCSDRYRLVYADAVFAGSHVHLNLEVGECPRSRRPAYSCDDEVPLAGGGQATRLDGCEAVPLEDGRVLVTGTHTGYQDPTYRVAVVYDDTLRYTVTTDEDSQVTSDEVARIARDPRVGATVDAAYVVAGRALTPPERG